MTCTLGLLPTFTPGCELTAGLRMRALFTVQQGAPTPILTTRDQGIGSCRLMAHVGAHRTADDGTAEPLNRPAPPREIQLLPLVLPPVAGDYGDIVLEETDDLGIRSALECSPWQHHAREGSFHVWLSSSFNTA